MAERLDMMIVMSAEVAVDLDEHLPPMLADAAARGHATVVGEWTTELFTPEQFRERFPDRRVQMRDGEVVCYASCQAERDVA